MTRRYVIDTLFVCTIVILIAACGPGASPTPLPPTPTDVPTTVPTATPTPEPADEVAFEEGFEGDLAGWEQGADVPEDPARPGQPVAWEIEIGDEQAAEGSSSARFTLDGKQDDGTIWLARPFDVAPDTMLRVRLAFQFWSASESFNTLAKVAAYAGAQPPAAEENFDVEQAANRAEGWVTYEYAFDVQSGPDGEVWVALGISAVWETELVYYVDEVRVDIVPAEAGMPTVDDPLLVLPESAVPIHSAAADLNGDRSQEMIVLAGWGGGPNQLGYDFLQMFVIVPAGPGEYVIAWQSEQLSTDRAEPLQVQDVDGDGLPEVLSVQAMGASGEMLYLLSGQDGTYGWSAPQGGYFDGQDAFGETGVQVEDVDGDGVAEILASYGPATSQIDVYAWDGEAYVYQETLDAAEARYQRVNVAEAGLSLEVPVEWGQIEPSVWAAPGEDGLRLGMAWVDVRPPQEPEAALLPQPAQVLHSEAVQLAWGSGRRFVVEVYGEAVQGGGQAPVEAVEIHTLIVVEREGARRAYDVYVSAPTQEQLVVLEPLLAHALESVVIE